MASISVFCGSSAGSDPLHRTTAEELGATLAAGGHRLVYGGGHVGLMGVVADAAIEAGGDVTGVITQHLHSLEVGHLGLTELEVELDMHARKARMAALSDGVIVLPGGFGTCDEAFEILTWNQLGIVSMPVVYLDVDHFYAPLFDFIAGVVDAGFMKPEHGALAQRATSVGDAVRIATAPPAEFTPKWVSRPR